MDYLGAQVRARALDWRVHLALGGAAGVALLELVGELYRVAFFFVVLVATLLLSTLNFVDWKSIAAGERTGLDAQLEVVPPEPLLARIVHDRDPAGSLGSPHDAGIQVQCRGFVSEAQAVVVGLEVVISDGKEELCVDTFAPTLLRALQGLRTRLVVCGVVPDHHTVDSGMLGLLAPQCGGAESLFVALIRRLLTHVAEVTVTAMLVPLPPGEDESKDASAEAAATAAAAMTAAAVATVVAVAAGGAGLAMGDTDDEGEGSCYGSPVASRTASPHPTDATALEPPCVVPVRSPTNSTPPPPSCMHTVRSMHDAEALAAMLLQTHTQPPGQPPLVTCSDISGDIALALTIHLPAATDRPARGCVQLLSLSSPSSAPHRSLARAHSLLTFPPPTADPWDATVVVVCRSCDSAAVARLAALAEATCEGSLHSGSDCCTGNHADVDGELESTVLVMRRDPVPGRLSSSSIPLSSTQSAPAASTPLASASALATAGPAGPHSLLPINPVSLLPPRYARSSLWSLPALPLDPPGLLLSPSPTTTSASDAAGRASAHSISSAASGLSVLCGKAVSAHSPLHACADAERDASLASHHPDDSFDTDRSLAIDSDVDQHASSPSSHLHRAESIPEHHHHHRHPHPHSQQRSQHSQQHSQHSQQYRHGMGRSHSEPAAERDSASLLFARGPGIPARHSFARFCSVLEQREAADSITHGADGEHDSEGDTAFDSVVVDDGRVEFAPAPMPTDLPVHVVHDDDYSLHHHTRDAALAAAQTELTHLRAQATELARLRAAGGVFDRLHLAETEAARVRWLEGEVARLAVVAGEAARLAAAVREMDRLRCKYDELLTLVLEVAPHALERCTF